MKFLFFRYPGWVKQWATVKSTGKKTFLAGNSNLSLNTYVPVYRNREVSFMGGPPMVSEENEDIGDNADDIENLTGDFGNGNRGWGEKK